MHNYVKKLPTFWDYVCGFWIRLYLMYFRVVFLVFRAKFNSYIRAYNDILQHALWVLSKILSTDAGALLTFGWGLYGQVSFPS